MRIIRVWYAGRLLQQQWTYRLSEIDDSYSLDVKPEHESDDAYTSAIGHITATRLAQEFILQDRLWLAAEEEAHYENETRNRVVSIRRSA